MMSLRHPLQHPFPHVPLGPLTCRLLLTLRCEELEDVVWLSVMLNSQLVIMKIHLDIHNKVRARGPGLF